MKSDIKNIGLIAPDVDSHSVMYNHFSGLKEGEKYGDVWGVDINQAYLNALYILGYITRETLEYCNNLKKSERLKLVGSLATVKFKEVYKNGKLVKISKKEDKFNRRIFFHVAQYVGNCMREVMYSVPRKCLFYWVDGIYFKTNLEFYEKDIILSIFKKYKFEVKEEKVSNFEVFKEFGFLKIKMLKNNQIKEYCIKKL